MTVAGCGILLGEVVEYISHAEAVAAHFVGVRRPDAFAGCANLGLALGGLVGLVKQAVCGQNQVRFLGDKQALFEVVAGSGQLLCLLLEENRVEDYTIAYEVEFVALENT